MKKWVQFEWQPYLHFAEELIEHVSEADSCLCIACTDMIFYSIVEPHNADRVMKLETNPTSTTPSNSLER